MIRFLELNKIIIKLKNKTVTEKIWNYKDLFSFKNIKSCKQIYGIYQKIQCIYNDCWKWIKTYITEILDYEKVFLNKRIPLRESSTIYGNLFTQIESIIAFLKFSFKPNDELVFIHDVDFHKLASIFLYVYSSFDIMSCLIYIYFLGNDKFDDEKLRNIKFHKTTTYFSLENSKETSEFKNEIDNIISSPSFKYIKNLRNSFTHKPKHPLLRYHFSTDIMVCFIVIVQTMKVLKKFLKFE